MNKQEFDETAERIAFESPYTLGMVRFVLQAVETEERTRAVLDFASRCPDCISPLDVVSFIREYSPK